MIDWEKRDRFYIIHHRNGEITSPKLTKIMSAIVDIGVTDLIAAIDLQEDVTIEPEQERATLLQKLEWFYATNFVHLGSISKILEHSKDPEELYKLIGGGAKIMAEVYEEFARDREIAAEEEGVLYKGRPDLYRAASVAYKQVAKEAEKFKKWSNTPAFVDQMETVFLDSLRLLTTVRGSGFASKITSQRKEESMEIG